MKNVTIAATDEVFDTEWNGIKYTLYITENKRWITIEDDDQCIHLDLEHVIKMCHGILNALSALYANEEQIKDVMEKFK